MTCKDVTDFLMRYLDGELTPAEAAAFDAHLAICTQCIDYIESYRDVVRLSGESARVDPPAEMPEELVRAILDARRNRPDNPPS